MNAAVSRRTVLVLASLAWTGSAAVALAAPMSFDVPLAGAQEVPPVHSSGHGTAALTYDPGTRQVTWSVTYSGLSSAVTMAHFHGPAPAGKNAPVAIWISKQGSPPASPITGEATLTPAEAEQFTAGQWYINVHSKDHPAGEIRGQVTPPKG
ncbi:MAG TPA: CHRD domain-containing protein [Acetobacteraceae bacterium]|nr:CHRD domain-containing protein [Acetobacteraceae bacterium]